MFIRIENLEDWQRYREAASVALGPTPPGADQWERQRRIMAVYVPTDRDARVSAAVWSTMYRAGGTKRHWLGIDGQSNCGKSELLLRFATDFHNQQTECDRPDSDRSMYRHIPVIFIQVDPDVQGAGLLKAIAEFAGIPSQGTVDVLRRRLAQILPRLGTRVIIVDDAHMLTRNTYHSARLPDSLRANLRLPVTFVYVGAGLRNSALLKAGSRGGGLESTQQLRARSTILGLQPLSWPADRGLFERLLGEYLRTIRILEPRLDLPFHRDPRCLRQVFEISCGLPGAIMGGLKDASVRAIRNSTQVTSEQLIQCTVRQMAESR